VVSVCNLINHLLFTGKWKRDSWVSTATMVTWTCRNVPLYIHCLSCCPQRCDVVWTFMSTLLCVSHL